MAELKTKNLVILDVEEDHSMDEKENFVTSIKNTLFRPGKISLRQKVVFFRILSTMVNASLTVLKSLTALKRQEKDKEMVKFYEFMIDKIQKGMPLNQGLREYYGNFTDAEVSIVEAGERTGKLNSALIQIADQTEKVDSITRKLKGAMTYPAVLVVGMIGAVAVLMIKVIPTLTEFFGDIDKLPSTTQLIVKVSNFFINYWFWLLLVAVSVFVIVMFWKKTAEGKYRWDALMLKLPIYGPLVRKMVLSRFARVLANLLGSGVAVVEAIRIVSSAVGNEVYRQRILLLRQDVKSGKKIAESIEDDPLFPDLLVSMMRVGEETAQVGTTVVKIADFYDEEVDITINSIQKLIEPVILVIMAVVIGILAIGIFQPIMNLAGTITG